MTMAAAVITLAAGYPLAGALGDRLFRHTPRGRVIVATTGVLLGALLLLVTLNVPVGNQGLFMVLLMLTALFIPFGGPNVVSTVYDITLPEVRSTALAVQYFIESSGAALAPTIAGLIADRSSLHDAILIICVSAWLLCAACFLGVVRVLPKDIALLRSQMRERAAADAQVAGAPPQHS